MTFSITTLSIMTLSITTFSITTLSITTFSILTLSIMTFSIIVKKNLIVNIWTLGIIAEHCYAEWHLCRLPLMLSVA